MPDGQVADAEIAIDVEDRILRLGGHMLLPGQIKHMIVNRDATEEDAVAGSVVVETMPFTTAAGSQVQVDFRDAQTADKLERFSQANGIGITSTRLDNSRFHNRFWLEQV